MKRVDIKAILKDAVKRADLLARACAFLRAIGRKT